MSLSTHCIGHIITGSFMGRGNQYIQLVKVLYCKLPTNSKQLPAFPGFRTPISEVGGKSVTTLPPWPLLVVVNNTMKSTKNRYVNRKKIIGKCTGMFL